MFETTTPPQKALNIYSQAPWLLICLLFFASPPAGAQSVWFSGMDHSPSGQAVLNASPNGESLEITGIGDSGEDGVVVQLAEAEFVGFEFEGSLDPTLLPPGTTVTMEPRSAGAGALNSFGSVYLCVNDQHKWELGADFLNAGSDTYTISILNNGVIVWSEVGHPIGDRLEIPSFGIKIYASKSTEPTPSGGTTTTWEACIKTKGLTISPPDGSDEIDFDTIMIAPDVPSSVTPPPTEVALRVSGTPSLTLAKTSQKFNDLEVSGTGSAHVVSQEVTNGTLEVSNIGARGLDGLSVDTTNTSYDLIALSADTPLEPNPGAVVALRSLDDGGGELGSMRAEANAAGQWEFSAEFQGSDTFGMKLYNGATLVYEASGQSGISASCAGKPIGFYVNMGVTDGGCILCSNFLDQILITTSTGETVTGNAIQFHNDTPISGCSTELVLGGANLPPFAVVNVWDGGGAENCFNGTDDDGDGLVDGDDPDCGCIPPPFTIGDTNNDGQLNIADVVTLLSYLFSGGDLPAAENADFNEDSVINIADAIALLDYLFGG